MTSETPELRRVIPVPPDEEKRSGIVETVMTYGADAAVLLQTGMAVKDKITNRPPKYHGKHEGDGQHASGED